MTLQLCCQSGGRQHDKPLMLSMMMLLLCGYVSPMHACLRPVLSPCLVLAVGRASAPLCGTRSLGTLSAKSAGRSCIISANGRMEYGISSCATLSCTCTLIVAARSSTMIHPWGGGCVCVSILLRCGGQRCLVQRFCGLREPEWMQKLFKKIHGPEEPQPPQEPLRPETTPPCQ